MADRVWRDILDMKEENFDEFVKAELSGRIINDSHRLPENIRNKVFRKGGISVSGLTFTEKLYLLIELLGYNFLVVIFRGLNEGFPCETLNQAIKNKRAKKPLMDTAQLTYDSGLFVLGDKPLVSGLEYMRLANAMRAYKDVIPKNLRKLTPNTSQRELEKSMDAWSASLERYEMAKNRMKTTLCLSAAELFILLHLRNAKTCEVKDVAYKYRATPKASLDNLSTAFQTLKGKGHITVRHDGRRRVYEMSATGQLTLFHFLENVINPNAVN